MTKMLTGLTLMLLLLAGCDAATVSGGPDLDGAADSLDAAKKPSGEAETLILFDPDVPENPESIVFDKDDNAYITMVFTGEIRKLSPLLTQSTLTFLPLGLPCADASRITVALGLALDQHDDLYVAISTCDPANQGFWKVDKDDGSLTQIGNVPPTTVINGIDVDKGVVYGADTFDGRIWRVPAEGGTPEVWSDDPLLKRPPGAVFPGPNGLRVYKKRVYVANSSTGTIVAIPIENDGTAGAGVVHATLPPPQGCDEFAFDVHGRIYCTTDPFNTIVRLDPDGTTETLLTEADGLDGPTSAAFGRRGTNRKNLYITNAAFPQFSTTLRPSLMRLRLDIPGAP